MIKDQISKDLEEAVKAVGFKPGDIVLSIPENEKFGDYSTNIALQLANQKNESGYQSSQEIANAIIEKFGHPGYLERIDIAGPGFINLYLKPQALIKEINEILDKGLSYGSSSLGQKTKLQVEFISANPTGPLTLANGRGGALGDALSNVLSLAGYDVEREYYINDTGNQVRLLGESVLSKLGYIDPKETHYQGDYIKNLASKHPTEKDTDPMKFGERLADLLLEEEIKPSIKRFGINFDQYFSERSLHQDGEVGKTLDMLLEKELAYHKDGAIWFKSSEFGDEKDRVLVTSESERGQIEPTYYLSDIAHYLNTISRGYERKVNILGADHHGYEQRVLGVLDALGYSDFLTILFIQLVKLYQGGKEIKMSKRAGQFVTLDELLEEVPADVVRFFFLMHSANTHINFDLDLAKEQSSKNPVYYVQYAHARMANILAKVESFSSKTEKLAEDDELALIKHLIQFPELVEEIAKTLEVHKLTEYSMKLADLFHKFYEKYPVVMNSDKDLRDSRLNLVKAAKIVLGNTLTLMGISAPERM
jgi:arginyl-tRNA synthetase